MNTPELTTLNDQDWDRFVDTFAGSHPFQLSSWGEVKAKNGWSHHRVGVTAESGEIIGGAQILFLRAPFIGYVLAYIPRGPLIANDGIAYDQLLELLAGFARRQGATLLKIEPGLESLELGGNWRDGKQQILHPETSIINLEGETEDDVFADLKSGARRYIRKAGRGDLDIHAIESVEELSSVLELYRETADRADFNLYSEDYYRQVYTGLGNNNRIWIARDSSKKPTAFLWTAHAGDTAIYLYGGSNDAGRDTHANYLLQWQAIRHYHSLGLTWYDLNGHVSDGVSSFKSKFTNNKVSFIGTLDLPLRPFHYAVWETLLPKLKPVLHFIKSTFRG